jgi:hypothetical protein
MLCLSYYCLCLLFDKIGDKGRTGSAWKQGGCGERKGVRNGPNNVCTHLINRNKHWLREKMGKRRKKMTMVDVLSIQE